MPSVINYSSRISDWLLLIPGYLKALNVARAYNSKSQYDLWNMFHKKRS